jgi:hypothetical protein
MDCWGAKDADIELLDLWRRLWTVRVFGTSDSLELGSV